MVAHVSHRLTHRGTIARELATIIGNAVAPPAGYYPGAQTFDGAADYVTHAEGSMSVVPSDSKLWTGSAWFTVEGGAGTARPIWHATGARIQVRVSAANVWLIEGRDSSAVSSVLINGPAANVAAGEWHHLHFAIDMADTAKTILHVDGVESASVATFVTDAVLDFSTDWYCGANNTGGVLWNGRLAHLWMASGVYMPSWRLWNDGYGPPNLGPYGLVQGVRPNFYAPEGNVYGAGQRGTIGAASSEAGATVAAVGP